MADRRATERYTATELSLSQHRIHAVMYNELHMSTLSEHWVTKLLGSDLKRARFNMSLKNRVIF